MTEGKDRFSFIEHTFFVDGTAARAVRLLDASNAGRSDSKRPRNLGRLLGHHDEMHISDRMTWEREAFDQLLDYFGMVEIACLAGCVRTEDMPETHLDLAARSLGHADVRRYFEEHYPIALPRAHRLRVLGHPLRQNPSERLQQKEELFEEFFTLSQLLQEGDAVETFLWFLDGGSRQGFDIDDTIKALERPGSFLECSSAMAEDFDDELLPPLSASVQGFLAFMDFVPRLQALLTRAQEAPILQSALWHYYGYWFSQMNLQMGAGVRRALRAIHKWQDALDHSSFAGRLDTLSLEQDLAYLSSGRFSHALNEALFHRERNVGEPPEARSFKAVGLTKATGPVSVEILGELPSEAPQLIQAMGLDVDNLRAMVLAHAIHESALIVMLQHGYIAMSTEGGMTQLWLARRTKKLEQALHSHPEALFSVMAFVRLLKLLGSVHVVHWGIPKPPAIEDLD